MAHHQTGSDLNFADCRQGDGRVLVAIGLVALAIALVGGAVSLGAWRQNLRSKGQNGATPRFIAILSTMASALLSLTLLLQIAASLTLPPCFR
jgi:hypothetical protein